MSKKKLLDTFWRKSSKPEDMGPGRVETDKGLVLETGDTVMIKPTHISDSLRAEVVGVFWRKSGGSYVLHVEVRFNPFREKYSHMEGKHKIYVADELDFCVGYNPEWKVDENLEPLKYQGFYDELEEWERKPVEEGRLEARWAYGQMPIRNGAMHKYISWAGVNYGDELPDYLKAVGVHVVNNKEDVGPSES